MRFKLPIDPWYYGTYSNGQSERRLGGRMALVSMITVGSHNIHIVSVHLEVRDSDQVQEAADLCDLLDRIGAKRVILGGDLNSDGSAFIGRLQQCGFLPREESNDLSSDGYSFRPTSCSDDGVGQGMDKRLDWIAIKGLRVVPGSKRTVAPGYDNGSCMTDHAAVMVDVELM